MNQDMEIYYVGKKPMKRDTVAGTNTVWVGYGSSRLVSRSAAERLILFPSVWVDPKTWEREYADDEPKTTASSAGGLSSLPVLDGSNLAASGDGSTAEPLAPTPVDRKKAIQEAIRKLDRTNKDHFGGTGLPKISAVRTAMDDESVTTQEMSEAFNEIKDEFRA